ncbi:MAG TPA: SpoIID/LytB domain-containing protein, partial [Actinomycetota bacterium]|nr:SpoIID/LytB domain-containing protein [Actinomycetota bacterium]
PLPTVELAGHGWGHGRGLGQYGALGYALQGWQYPQILDHFYGGSQSGPNPAPSMSVRLTGFDGNDTIVVQEQSHLSTPVDGGAGRYAALRAHLIGPNQFEVDSGPGCQGPWTPLAASTAGPVTFNPAVPTPSSSMDRTELLQVCLPAGGTQWLRGSIQAVDALGQGNGADQRTVNDLGMEDYLLGVVPSESPASWGSLGGGAGMEALKAQAVAARSYAASQNRYAYAKICDTDSCQVYRGRAIQDAAGFRDVEDARTTAAVNATAGQVRVTAGQVVSTEFSSSTGGYTAGGRFPSVPDDGDAVSLNPNHNWDVTVPVSMLESAYAGIGNLVWMQVTQRNGLGDLGGRATQIQIQGTAGTTTTTGDDFAARLGLRSNWFRVVYPGGYWIAGSDGGVFSFGNAQFFGSTGGTRLVKPIVGIEATPSRQGYWLVASDGGVFSFGDASFLGSTGGKRLNKPVVGLALHSTGQGVTATASGYWMVATDGGIFAFGDAGFFGSTGSIRLNQPIVGMAPTPTGQGYWLVASDGGIFAFGDARFLGSTGSIRLNQPVTTIRATPTGAGYYLLGRDGGIFNFGDAAFFGAVPGLVTGASAAIPKVGMAISQIH